MDLNLAFERVAEPLVTSRLRSLLEAARRGLTSWQQQELVYRNSAGAVDRALLDAIEGNVGDGARLRAYHAQRARRGRRGKRPVKPLDPAVFDVLPGALAQAAERPAVASAFVWAWLGDGDPDLAVQLVQLVRMRAQLPALRGHLGEHSAGLRDAQADLSALVRHFGDLQVEDACAWLESIPTPLGPADDATLAAHVEAITEMRARATRITTDELAAFFRRAAQFLVELSVRGLDPIGFPLGREVTLETDPPHARRIDLAAWARLAGHHISARGLLFVLGIPVEAPWPLRLEVIAAELGHGHSGAVVLMLRLDGPGRVAVTSPASVLLCFPNEPSDERGARFERWLAGAYPAAIQPWRAWS